MQNMFEQNDTDKVSIQRKYMQEQLADLRVAMPGTVESVNWSQQTVSVRLGIREKVNIDGTLEWEEIPVLPDVPFFMPRAGGYLLTLPVSPGDECLVVFGDCCIDGWWQNAGVQNQVDRRRHDLSDGFALIGVWSQPRRISGYSTSTAQLRNESGSAFVELDGNNIRIKGSTVSIEADNIKTESSSYKIEATNFGIEAENSVIDGGGRTMIDGRQFMEHTHSGVESGPSNTGGVV